MDVDRPPGGDPLRTAQTMQPTSSSTSAARLWDRIRWWVSPLATTHPRRRHRAFERLLARRDVTGLLLGLRLGDGATREQAAKVLAEVEDPRVKPALLTALGDPEGKVRAAAIVALVAVDGLRTRDRLLCALDDPAECVQLAAVQVLGSDPAVAEKLWHLVAQATKGVDRRIATAALSLLARGPDPEQASVVLTLLATQTDRLSPLTDCHPDEPLLSAAAAALPILDPAWRTTPAGNLLATHLKNEILQALRQYYKTQHRSDAAVLPSPFLLSLYVGLCADMLSDSVLRQLADITDSSIVAYAETQDAQGFALPTPKFSYHGRSADYSQVRRKAKDELLRRRPTSSPAPDSED